MLEIIFTLALLGAVAFIQNMMFTLVSRSRNSGDPNYHRFCAWGSNGVWIICYLLILKNVWNSVENGNWLYAGLSVLVYTIATTEGSVLMMKRLIKSETGTRKVGATGGDTDPDKLLARIISLEEKTKEAEKYNAEIDEMNKEVDKANQAAAKDEDLIGLQVSNVKYTVKRLIEKVCKLEEDIYDITQESGAGPDDSDASFDIQGRIKQLEKDLKPINEAFQEGLTMMEGDFEAEDPEDTEDYEIELVLDDDPDLQGADEPADQNLSWDSFEAEIEQEGNNS